MMERTGGDSWGRWGFHVCWPVGEFCDGLLLTEMDLVLAGESESLRWEMIASLHPVY